MSDEAHQPSGKSPKQRYRAVGLIPAVGAVLGGAVATFRGATGDLGSIFLVVGPVLMVLGVIAFFVYRWMAKRGL
jgi:ABC-type sulfate transport system permease component